MYQERPPGTLLGMLLLMFVVIGLVVFGWIGWVTLYGVDRGQKRSEANADQILDTAFDGREDVTFPINMQSVKYETVITGAKKRGYKLAHQADGPHGPRTLIFEKV